MLFRVFPVLLLLIVQQEGAVLAKPYNRSLTRVHCTNSPYWVDPAFNPRDCDDALNEFLDTSVAEHEVTAFEFLAPGTHPMHALPQVQTPMKITVRTCTLAIAMLASFAPGMLPGVGLEPYPPTDVASFREIYFTALAGGVQCTRRQGKAGWSHTGGRQAVGVFFWGTESGINTLVRNGMQLLKPPKLDNTTIDNVSAMQ